MKKFLVCFAVLSAMVFMMGCGKILEQVNTLAELQWSKRSSEAMDWNAAKNYCSNLNEGGYKDWRLPNIDELKTLVRNCPRSQMCKVSEKNDCLSTYCSENCSCGDKRGNAGYYSKLKDDDKVSLWSSSIAYENNVNAAWSVNFMDGGVWGKDKTPGLGWKIYVRCVR